MKKIFVLLLAISFMFSISLSTFANENVAVKTVKATGTFQNGAFSGMQTLAQPSTLNDTIRYSLSTDASDICDAIYDAVQNLQESVDLGSYNIPEADLNDYFETVINDHPDLFYLSNNYSYNYIIYPTGNIIKDLYLNYLYDEEDIPAMVNSYNDKVKYILSNVISNDMTAKEKFLALHDYLILNTKYDEENFLNDTVPDISYTSYGLFVNHIAVCQGYALAMKELCNKIGLNCVVIGSDFMNHAWNLVQLDNKWYHMDVTWDDPVFTKTDDYDIEGYVSHTFFLLSDATISDTEHQHTGWDTDDYPACTDITYESVQFDTVTSGMFFINGKWYLCKDYVLYSSDFSGQNMTSITTGKRVFNFALRRNFIYYINYTTTSPHKVEIRKLNLNTMDDTKIYETTDTLYEISAVGDTLRFLTSTGVLNTIDLKQYDTTPCSIGYPLFENDDLYSNLPTSSSSNDMVISIACNAPTISDVYIYTAFYNANNKLIEVNKNDITVSDSAKSYSISIDSANLSDTKYIKVFLFDDHLKPLATSTVVTK